MLGGGDTEDVRLVMRPPPHAKERAVPRRIPDERAAARPHPVALKEKEGKCCNCRIVGRAALLGSGSGSRSRSRSLLICIVIIY